jgi:hypothetical protein
VQRRLAAGSFSEAPAGREVRKMTSIGWEYFGIKFSMLMTMLVSTIMIVSVWLTARKSDHFGHVDNMAGDEGED